MLRVGLIAAQTDILAGNVGRKSYGAFGGRGGGVFLLAGGGCSYGEQGGHGEGLAAGEKGGRR